MVTASERGREVRRKLLNVALELVPELGWNAVSTRVLAERAGVAPGLVHYHFSSLQAVLREAAVGEMRRTLGAAIPEFERAGTPADGIGMMLESLDAYTGDDPASLMFTEAYLVSARDEELRGELAGLLAEFRDGLARWLGEHGQERPVETASVLAAAVDGVLLHRPLNPGLTSSAVAPVLRRLLGPDVEGEEHR